MFLGFATLTFSQNQKTNKKQNGQVEYLNSGDWIENLTALEYNNKAWSLYKYNPEEFKIKVPNENNDELILMENDQIFNQMLGNFLEKKDIITDINFK